jgi:hypothetical protein
MPGHDALVLAACANSESIGHQDILDHIHEMGREVKIQKPLPEPWTPEARGEKI